MEKNAVLGRNTTEKRASLDSVCPICGSALDYDGSLPRCPKHGTRPFEAYSYIKRRSDD